MKLSLQALTAETFAPYGEVVSQPQRPNDAGGPGWRWWGEVVRMGGGDRPYAIGYLDLTPAPLTFDWAERHMQSDELLVPLGSDCAVYVGPPAYPDEPDRMPALDQFAVFKVPQGQAVLLKPGTWHGAPMAIDAPTKVLVILLKNTGNQDMHLVRFEDTPVEIAR